VFEDPLHAPARPTNTTTHACARTRPGRRDLPRRRPNDRSGTTMWLLQR
jgi:hypothetical protein